MIYVSYWCQQDKWVRLNLCPFLFCKNLRPYGTWALACPLTKFPAAAAAIILSRNNFLIDVRVIHHYQIGNVWTVWPMLQITLNLHSFFLSTKVHQLGSDPILSPAELSLLLQKPIKKTPHGMSVLSEGWTDTYDLRCAVLSVLHHTQFFYDLQNILPPGNFDLKYNGSICGSCKSWNTAKGIS